MSLELRNGDQATTAEVFTVIGDHRVHLLSVRSPQGALELFRLLDEELAICATCGEPMWTAVGGICGDLGPYCSGCQHPSCNRLECDRKAM